MKIINARILFYATILIVPPLLVVFSEPTIRFPTTAVRIFLFAIFSIFIIAAIEYMLRQMQHKQSGIAQTAQNKNLFQLAYEYNDEIIIMLNQYAQIISFNNAFMQTFYYQLNELFKRPFRDLIHPEFSNRRIHEKLLTKLKEVYKGNQTQFICTCRRSGDNEPVSVSFRFIPIMEANNVAYILVIGNLLQSDHLTMKYLVNESSQYIIDNDLSLIFLLCHRLTRNLEDRLPRSTILMAQIALQEVFLNAVEHGNLEISYERKTELKAQNGNYWELLLKECNKDHLKNRKIHVSYFLDNKKVVYTIRDEGKGFDWKKFLNERTNNISNNIIKNYHGVGLEIVKSVFDIHFNEKGNEITLIKEFAEKSD